MNPTASIFAIQGIAPRHIKHTPFFAEVKQKIYFAHNLLSAKGLHFRNNLRKISYQE